MAKLLPVEKQIVATALLAMYAECPEDEREGMTLLFASISQKLGLAEAFEAIKAAVADAERGPGEGSLG